MRERGEKGRRRIREKRNDSGGGEGEEREVLSLLVVSMHCPLATSNVYILFRSASGHADPPDHWNHGQHLAAAGTGPQVRSHTNPEYSTVRSPSSPPPSYPSSPLPLPLPPHSPPSSPFPPPPPPQVVAIRSTVHWEQSGVH